MRLATRIQVHAEELPILRETQCRHMEVCQVDIYLPAAMCPRHALFINDGQIQCNGNGRIDAACRCSCIDKRSVFGLW